MGVGVMDLTRSWGRSVPVNDCDWFAFVVTRADRVARGTKAPHAAARVPEREYPGRDVDDARIAVTFLSSTRARLQGHNF
jgi:hypothetical protein